MCMRLLAGNRRVKIDAMQRTKFKNCSFFFIGLTSTNLVVR